MAKVLKAQKVRIIKSSDPRYWYTEQIGKEFVVIDYYRHDYKLIVARGEERLIKSDDCLVID